jgi:hypothetical protein
MTERHDLKAERGFCPQTAERLAESLRDVLRGYRAATGKFGHRTEFSDARIEKAQRALEAYELHDNLRKSLSQTIEEMEKETGV